MIQKGQCRHQESITYTIVLDFRGTALIIRTMETRNRNSEMKALIKTGKFSDRYIRRVIKSDEIGEFVSYKGMKAYLYEAEDGRARCIDYMV